MESNLVKCPMCGEKFSLNDLDAVDDISWDDGENVQGTVFCYNCGECGYVKGHISWTFVPLVSEQDKAQ